MGAGQVSAGRQIRIAAAEDAADIAAIYAPFVANTIVSFETEPPDETETRARISKVLESYPWLVCEQDGRVIGYAYGSQHRVRRAYQWSVDVAVYVDPNHHRGGIARSLYTRLFELLRLQGYYNAYAGIALPNAASVGFHESMGFRPIGIYEEVGFKAGKWVDVGWWQLALQPKQAEPGEPGSRAKG